MADEISSGRDIRLSLFQRTQRLSQALRVHYLTYLNSYITYHKQCLFLLPLLNLALLGPKVPLCHHI